MMDEENCITLFRDLCASFLAPHQERIIAEHDLTKLVKSLLLNVFVRFKNDEDKLQDPYSLIRTEIIARIIGNKSKWQKNTEEINKYLTDLEKMYMNCVEKEELNAMFSFFYSLSQFQDFVDDAHQAKNSAISFFGGNFSGSNWDIFHQEPSPVCTDFNYPFYAPFGTGIKLIQDFCPVFEPMTSDFSKIYDGKCKVYRFDLNRPVEPTSQDEGFVTPGSEFSSDTDTGSDHSFKSEMSISRSLDELAFDAQSLKLRKKTWMQLGSEDYLAELPFVSEHAESVIHLWKIFNASQNPRFKAFPIEDRVQCTFEELMNDLRYLLFGMNSSSFFYNSITKTFYVRDKLHMKTLTPEIVSSMCEPFLECAAYYYALKTFVEQRNNLSFGPTHQVYCLSLQEVLNVYRFSILNLDWTNIRFTSQLEPFVTPYKRKLQFLTKFCLITVGADIGGSSFPSGVQLLDYLFTNLMKISRSDFSCIMIHFFEKCCNMYLKIVSEWIFEGCFSNPLNYEEFFIEIQREDELCRDWRRVSCIKMKEKRVPKFLEKFYKDVFICGKSVNLLKIFTYRDVLETLLPRSYPSIKCCFNKKQFDEYALNWQSFQANNNNGFNSQKVKDVLFKTYGSDFYANIKKVREAWFTNYENHLKSSNTVCEEIPSKDVSETVAIISASKNGVDHNQIITQEIQSEDKDKSKELPNLTTSLKPDDVISKLQLSGLKTEITKKPSESESCLNSNDTVTEDLTEAEVQKKEVKIKTKKLVDFFEQLNSSNISPEKSPRKSSIDVTRSSISPIKPSRENEAMRISSAESNSPELEKFEINEKTKISSPSSVSDQSALKNTSIADTSAAPREKVQFDKCSSFSHAGGGDFVSASDRCPVLDQVIGACGDAPAQLRKSNENICVQIKDQASTSIQLSDLQRNRLKSIRSDYQDSLHPTDEIPLTIKLNSTPFSIREQNRLKSMSSDNVCQTNSGNVTIMKKDTSTPMNSHNQNKLKIMSSEYHQRLTGSGDISSSHSQIQTEQKPRELSEYEKNKLKVMSSEYHLRLLDCVNHDEQIEEKLNSRLPCKLSEREINRRAAMTSEFHIQLKALPIEPQVTNSPVISETKEHEETVSSITNVTDFNDEPETISEDVESEDQVTVIENVVTDDSLPFNDVSRKNSSVAVDISESASTSDVLNLERYVSFGPTVFARHNVDAISCLKAAVKSVDNVDRTSLMYYLSQSILIPLRIQSTIINEAILRVFIDEEGYLQHLTTLRNYLFLHKPEFTILLTNTMFKMVEKVKKPYLLLNNYTLSCLLQQSLLAGNVRESIRFERKLFFVIDDTVPQSFDLHDIKALKCVSLKYSVKWPVNVLLTEPIIKKYSRVFKFLMQIQRASWTLKNDFKILKNLKRGKSMQYTQIQLYRHCMTQVVRILQEFVMREGLGRCWNELVEYMSGSEITLDGLYLSHLKYINKIMQRCFLCDLSITCHDSVLNLLSSVLQYHAALRAGTWHRNTEVNFLYHTNFKNIHSVFSQFQLHLNDIRGKLTSLVYTQQRLYFEPLLLELSRNENTV